MESHFHFLVLHYSAVMMPFKEINVLKEVVIMDNKSAFCGRISTDSGIKNGYILTDINSGIIEEVNFSKDMPEFFSGDIFKYDDNYIIYPGDFNCHSHPEQSIYTDIINKSWDLGTWCRNTIYKYSSVLKNEHIYLGCLRAFSRMLLLGDTSVMVSYYCHGNKGNTLDNEVLRAAKDVGIRLYFGRMNYDIMNEDAYEGKKVSQKSYYESPSEAEKNFLALLNECYPNTITVAPSLHSIHASSKDAIINGINLAFDHNRYIQFHLSEDKGDVDLSLKLYGFRPIEFLESLLKNGEVKSLSHVILSDCVWINDNESDIIKRYGMKVVLNPRMNHRIKTGSANLTKLLEKNITIYLGTDGEASNDDLSIMHERDFLKDRYKNIDESIIDLLGSTPLKLGEGFVGNIAKNSFCDLKILDSKNNVKDVFVGGNQIIRDYKLISMDIEKDIEEPLKQSLSNLFL